MNNNLNIYIITNNTVGFPSDSTSQLDILGLYCHPLGVDGQQVHIPHNPYHVSLHPLMQSIQCLLLPSQGTGCIFSLLEFCIHQHGGFRVISFKACPFPCVISLTSLNANEYINKVQCTAICSTCLTRSTYVYCTVHQN